MARKYKFKLFEKEIVKINKILDDNNVTFSFDEIKNYLDAMHQIAPIVHESYDRYLKFINEKNFDTTIKNLEENIKLKNLNRRSLIKSSEYEVTDDVKLITTGYGYQFISIDSCPISNPLDCADILMEIFFDMGIDGIFDIMSQYGLMYSGDGSDKLYEGLYLWVNSSIFDRRSEEDKRFIFKSLCIEDNHIDFLCNTDCNLRLDYVGFNENNKIVKYAIKFPREEFFPKQSQSYFADYCKINDVITCVEKSPHDTDIAMQFVPGKPDSIAIESEISIENYHSEIEQLISSNIIGESQGEKLLNMSMKKYHHAMLKYKWKSKDNLQVKVYLIEDLLTT